MTLGTRNAVFYACAGLSALLLAAYFVVMALIIGAADQSIASLIPSTQRWFVWVWNTPEGTGVSSLIGIGAIGLLSFLTLAITSRVFRRVTSAEIYFFAVFLFTLAIDQIRVSQLLLMLTDQPRQSGVIVTRIVMFGRIIGSFTLFTASLYAVGVDFPRIGALTMLTAVLAFVIIWFVPVDTLHITASLVHVTGGRGSIDIVLSALAILTVVDYLVAGIRGHRDRGIAVAISATALVIGRELAFRAPSPAGVYIGCALTLYGCGTYVVFNRRNYLWY